MKILVSTEETQVDMDLSKLTEGQIEQLEIFMTLVKDYKTSAEAEITEYHGDPEHGYAELAKDIEDRKQRFLAAYNK